MVALIMGPQKVYISNNGSSRVYFQVTEKNDILEIVYKGERKSEAGWESREILRDRIVPTASNMRAINSNYSSDTFLSFLKETSSYKTALKYANV